MDRPSSVNNPTTEDFEYCRGELMKMTRKLNRGKINIDEHDDMLLDAVTYGNTVVSYCVGLQNKPASKGRRDEVDSSSDSDSKCGGVDLASKILDVSASKKRARNDDAGSEGEDYSKPLKKVRMMTNKKRTRDAVEAGDSSDDRQTWRSSKKARLGGENVEAAKVFRDLDALLKTSVKGSK